MSSPIGFILLIFYLKIVPGELLSLLNLIRIQNFYIYKLIKVVIFG